MVVKIKEIRDTQDLLQIPKIKNIKTKVKNKKMLLILQELIQNFLLMIAQ